jgi:chromosome segregation protein
VERTAVAAAAASTRALAAEAALPALREEAAVAQAVLGRLQLDGERADREEAAARADVDRLAGALRHCPTISRGKARWSTKPCGC